ncbi:hypothetical protein REPUB_Repub12eG0120900 [Reevesia pubescens]
MILHLAFQSLGIVYGGLGTSPLYVFSSRFNEGIKHRDDILGVYSLIFYTFTLLLLVKYILIVLRATDNGDGGTFALYSLICRYAKVRLIPSQQAEDHDVSNFQIELPSMRLKWASALKFKLEKSQFAMYFLLLATMLGTSMLIGMASLHLPFQVIRTSAKYQGQVYIPEINYLLMLACVGVTPGFRTTDKIGNAYGHPLALILL